MSTLSFPALGKYIDLLVDAVCVVDKHGHFLYVSPSAERIFGYTQAEMMGMQMLDLVHPDDRERTLNAVDSIVAGEPEPHFENRYQRKNGEIAHIMWSARWSEENQCRVAVARDITLRKRAEAVQQAVFAIAEASHNTQDLPSLYRQIHQIIAALLPADNCVIALYDAASDCISFPYHVDQHQPLPATQHLASDSDYARLIRRGQPLLLGSSSLSLQAGEQTPARSWLGVPLTIEGRTIGALVIKSYSESAVYSDETLKLLQYVSNQVAAAIDRRQLLLRLQQRALYDQLTRLPNRELFYDRIQSALARARRNNEMLSLVFMDLDKFKAVNDNYGHPVGDQLLEAVARRLELSVRECDTIARFGGDEFVILLENIEHPEQSEGVAGKILGQFATPFELQDTQANNIHLCITPSIGMAHFPLHGDNEKDLLHHADKAMYSLKSLQR
jgi:diguanylate cyclase (GGDEF)-like protein/PAS domain S-box-containing protein